VLNEARAWLPTLIIGPVPTADDMQPYVLPNGTQYHLHRDNTANQNAHCAALCAEIDVPYLDLFSLFAEDEAWDREQRAPIARLTILSHSQLDWRISRGESRHMLGTKCAKSASNHTP